MKLLSVSEIRSMAALNALETQPPRPDIPPLSEFYVGGKPFAVTDVSFKK